jgi:hypothetical protein
METIAHKPWGIGKVVVIAVIGGYIGGVLLFAILQGGRVLASYIPILHVRNLPTKETIWDGSVLGVIIVPALAVYFYFKAHGLAGIPEYIWPHQKHYETTVLIRLGRVVHWITLILGVLILALGVLFTVHDFKTMIDTQASADTWDRQHTVCDVATPQPAGQPPVIRAPLCHIINPTFGDSRPYVTNVGFDQFWGFSIAAILIAIFGRGLRYILGGE